jgi:hypothetical protein
MTLHYSPQSGKRQRGTLFCDSISAEVDRHGREKCQDRQARANVRLAQTLLRCGVFRGMVGTSAADSGGRNRRR